MLVALFTRAWIEIQTVTVILGGQIVSPSSRGRGLKFMIATDIYDHSDVALFTRAWIEMLTSSGISPAVKSRPLHEGVD